MKISIKQTILNQVLAHANRIVEKRLATPVLGCVLMETVDSEHINVTATNLDMTVVDIAPGNVEFTGAYCIPASLLYEITKKLPSASEIVIEKSNDTNSIAVTSNKTSFSLNYIESSEFPPVTAQEILQSFELNATTLKNALNTAKVAMSQDNTRIQLNGIHIHYENSNGLDTLRVVATDLFRIACVSMPVSADAKDINPIIISRRAVGELLHMLDDVPDDNSINVKLQNGQIMFEANLKNNIQSVFSTRLISGTFPEYKVALEVQNDKILQAKTEDLVNALDRVGTIITDTSNSVKLSLSDNTLTISGISREFGSATETIDVEFLSDEPLDICFNSRYLLELVRQIETEKVEILFNNSTSPTVIKPVSDNNTEKITFVIMPVELVHN